MASAFDLVLRGGALVLPWGVETADVGVRDGRIAAIGDLRTAAAAETLDCAGLHVLPGLIDAHVHLTGEPGGAYWRDAVDSDDYVALRGARNALVTLRAGFTTVRDLGSPGVTGFALKRAIDEGLVPGPSGGQQFDRDGPGEKVVLAAPDFAHAADRDAVGQPVPAGQQIVAH